MSFKAWLQDFLRIVPPEERHGITLAEQDALAVPLVRYLARIIRALDRSMPRDSILYLEGGSLPPDLKAFLDARHVSTGTRVDIGTIWPRPLIHHLPIESTNLQELAGLGGSRLAPDDVIPQS